MTTATRDIAGSFVAARQAARALPDFPGETPQGLAESYKIQDAAIEMWPDEVVGWKIGRVPAPQVAALGEDRVAGPVFSHNLWIARSGEEVAFPVFENGFAAVEGEVVFRIGADAPANKTEWSRDEVIGLIGAMHVGVETAGSPLATINDLGSTVVASDFGNNFGLILGPEAPDWRAKLEAGVSCETFIEGQSVGAGSANAAADGPIDALAFLASHLAKRGKPLKAGQYITTGAITGVHDIRIGQHSRVSFNGAGDILCMAVKAVANGRSVA
ncbi:MAG: 2-keto-4-pentenoate hydratase [Caulobacterales bacterium]|nr:2-keto-4-pentenoate hydratase [Caulobacterales bacterium]